jgi:hypothetical protein
MSTIAALMTRPGLLAATFVAGMIGVVVFHQGVWALFSMSGKTPTKAWSMAPTTPLGLPAVVSAALWGGVWALIILAIYWAFRPTLGIWTAFVGLGALLTSTIALCLVFPLKGHKFAAGFNPAIWIFALLLNAAWGFGTVLVLRYVFGAV